MIAGGSAVEPFVAQTLRSGRQAAVCPDARLQALARAAISASDSRRDAAELDRANEGAERRSRSAGKGEWAGVCVQ